MSPIALVPLEGQMSPIQGHNHDEPELAYSEFENLDLLVTQSQLEAITSPIDPGKTLQIIAGPGSGKTKTLVYKIAYMIGTLGIKPSEILVLSMTNRAVDTLNTQVEAIFGQGSSHGIDISTFHGFAHRLVAENEENHGNGLQMIEESGWRTLVNLVDGKFSRQQLSTLVDRIKVHGIDDKGVQSMARRFNIDITSLNEVLETLTTSNIKIHSEVLRSAKDLIRDGKIRQDYKVVIVDEFQDVYPEVYQLIELVGKTPHLVTAGDPDQSIYNFLGSNLEVHESLENLKPTDTVYLQETFRSTPEIIHASDALLGKENSAITLKEMDGIKPTAKFFNNETDQFEWISSEVMRLLEQGEGVIEPCDIAIMARTNAELSICKNFLNFNGISDIKLTSNPTWLSENLFSLVDYLRILSSPEEAKFSMICTLGLLPGVGRITVKRCYQGAIKEGVSVWEHLNNLNQNGKLAKKLVAYVEKLQKARDEIQFDNSESIFKVLLQLGHDLGLLESLSRKIETQQDKEHLINQLHEFYENLKVSQMNKNSDTSVTQHFLENYSNVYPISKNKTSVKLSTVHSAKGLEFPIVFLLGSPLSDTFRAEDKRLTYVAMTRAKTLLYVNKINTDPMSKHNFEKTFKEELFSRKRPEITGNFLRGYAKEFNRTLPNTTIRSLHTMTRLIKRL